MIHWLVRAAAMFAIAAGLLVAGCNRDPNVQKQRYLESGKRYEAEGKLREAAIQFANALKVDHNFGEACYELGKTYVALGNPNAGYAQLQRAVELEPSNLKAHLALGSMLLAGHAESRALVEVKAALALDTANAEAYGLLGRIDESHGDHARALADVRQALTLDPGKAKFHTELAMIEQAGGAAGAEQELRKAVSLDPKDVLAHLVLASILDKQGDVTGAEQQDQFAIDEDASSLQAYTSLAGLYLRSGDKKLAEQVLRKAAGELSESEAGAGLLRDFYVRTGQKDRAGPAYAELIEQCPKSVALKVIFVQILLSHEDFQKAQALVDELSKNNGSSTSVEWLRAMLLLHDGRTDDAYALLQKATRNSPDNVALQLMQGRVAIARGDLGSAQSSYRQAARLDASNESAYTGLAEVAKRRRDFGLLAQIADRTIALHPEFAQAYLWRGIAEVNQKQSGAEGDFENALKRNTEFAEAYFALGQLRLSQGRTAEGTALLEQALAHDPDLLIALQTLVRYDIASNDPAKAKERIEAQIARAPGNAGLYAMLAGLEMHRKNFNGASEAAARAMQLAPRSREAVSLYAQSAAAMGNRGQAIAAWLQWTAAHPNDAGAVTELGMLESTSGDIAKAMETYKKALQLDPDQAVAANNLAYLMVETGQNADVALSLAQSARRAIPNAASSADTLAWVYYYKGTYASARDLLEDALRAEPDNAAMHYHLGMIYSKLNDKADAALHLKRAAALAPHSPTAGQAVDALMHLG